MRALVSPLCRSWLHQVSRTSARSAASVLTPLEQKYFPHIGNREIVGFGRNGTPMYYDDVQYPYPGIRFRNHTDEIAALRQKEEGSWKNLTLDEVNTLYRHSFCRTLAEATAPLGIWKMGVGWMMIVCSAGLLTYIYLKGVLLDIPDNVAMLPEYKEAIKYKRIMGRRGSVKEVLDFDLSVTFRSLHIVRRLATAAESALEGVLRKRFEHARLIAVSDISGGCGAMYRVVVESEDFADMSVLAQHRAVKEALREHIKSMHGITIVTKE
ncbi:cytochrome c oxidase subunit IV [Opisthorchis viverrini]|uniref:Cytochrome c oxidase subunit IV n=1 Tax=Opisthorchis viverrini TaxID=6198 RepID=A0A1S8WJZ5_OPIVI|nr:cytochrome c oxidase subunit IV [Opisthorchis viverrini]